MMQYSILTTSDNSYFPHLKILVNSTLDKCDLNYLKTINIIDNGLTEEQINYLHKKSNIINIKTTGTKTNFKGGTWGEDWQLNVRGKTVHLHDMVSKIKEPLLMLDADMLVLQDLHTLLDRGGDMQVCVRPNAGTIYIGSYFFSINHKKTLPFINDWKELTQAGSGKRPHESPALTETVHKYKSMNSIDIVEIEQRVVNVHVPPPFKETVIVHFKGSSLFKSFDEQFNARIESRDWDEYVEEYLI